VELSATILRVNAGAKPGQFGRGRRAGCAASVPAVMARVSRQGRYGIQVLKDRRRADVNLSGNLYKLWNRPGNVLPIVPKEL
jgi:hypothetical protein